MKVKVFMKNYIEIVIFIFMKIILPKKKGKLNSLLFINTGYLGDLIVSSVILENSNIFEKYDRVDFVLKKQYLEIFSNYHGKVNFIGYNYVKYKYSLICKYKFLSSLRENRYSTCVHLTPLRGILNEELTHLSGASELIGLNDSRTYLGNYLGHYLDSKYKLFIGIDLLSEYEKMYRLLQFINKNSSNRIRFNQNLVFPTSKDEIRRGILNFREYIVIAPFPSLKFRRWKLEYLYEVVNSLKKTNNIILLGSPNQKAELEKMKGNSLNIKVIAGELKLSEIPSLLRKAQLFIGLDSGVTHIALKVGVPMIGIIGGGEFGRFFPFKESATVKYLYYKMDCFLCHWKCEKSEMFCLTNITHLDVLDEAHKLLK